MTAALLEAVATAGKLMLALSEAERERDELRGQLEAARAALVRRCRLSRRLRATARLYAEIDDGELCVLRDLMLEAAAALAQPEEGA